MEGLGVLRGFKTLASGLSVVNSRWPLRTLGIYGGFQGDC